MFANYDGQLDTKCLCGHTGHCTANCSALSLQTAGLNFHLLHPNSVTISKRFVILIDHLCIVLDRFLPTNQFQIMKCNLFINHVPLTSHQSPLHHFDQISQINQSKCSKRYINVGRQSPIAILLFFFYIES